MATKGKTSSCDGVATGSRSSLAPNRDRVRAVSFIIRSPSMGEDSSRLCAQRPDSKTGRGSEPGGYDARKAEYMRRTD
ncbi:hypothetical protein SDC9_200092 [bioreactor metagenome]|uniref:Uncharacterized protein n=1 Tax=bioreactor metagenome TaxID=1076179 RepID=A0A645IMA5_9ZZZZ